ncbi:cbb3-type cytochrome c oxidase subunit I, partial [Streptomyces collinus]
FNQAFTMHGTIMLLMFATPLFAGFTNWIMPLTVLYGLTLAQVLAWSAVWAWALDTAAAVSAGAGADAPPGYPVPLGQSLPMTRVRPVPVPCFSRLAGRPSALATVVASAFAPVP